MAFAENSNVTEHCNVEDPEMYFATLQQQSVVLRGVTKPKGALVTAVCSRPCSLLGMLFYVHGCFLKNSGTCSITWTFGQYMHLFSCRKKDWKPKHQMQHCKM